jgi:membrane-associated phospholipid phosphatase
MLCLAIAREWRLARLWCLLLGAGLLLVTITKIVFIGWGARIAKLDFTGISGHATRVAAIMPVMLPAQKARTWEGRLAVTAGMAFGFAIGVSRLMLQVHSGSEVMAGYILGAAISLAFIGMLAGAGRISFKTGPCTGAVAFRPSINGGAVLVQPWPALYSCRVEGGKGRSPVIWLTAFRRLHQALG